jgi:copper chaperone CopZ
VQTLIKIEGLSDDARAAALAATLKAVTGVIDAEVFVEDGLVSVLYDVRADVPTLVAAVTNAGYDARPL